MSLQLKKKLHVKILIAEIKKISSIRKEHEIQGLRMIFALSLSLSLCSLESKMKRKMREREESVRKKSVVVYYPFSTVVVTGAFVVEIFHIFFSCSKCDENLLKILLFLR